MAKFVKTEVESQSYDYNFSSASVILTGLIVGITAFIATLLLNNFINTLSTAGNLATLLAAVIGFVVLFRFRIAKGFVIAVASALSLWGLALWVDGLVWYEAIIFSCLLYALAYFVFAWMARMKNYYLVILAAVLTVVVVRLIVNL